MQCRNCGFLVPQNLRFAIMKNFCPQCGNKLFSDKEINHISMIQSRVLTQPFSHDLSEQTIYDISLFLYNEILNGYGRVILDEEIKNIVSKTKESLKSGSGDTMVESIEEIEFEEDIEKVKEKIREEEAARVASDHVALRAADEDAEAKVNRLKQVHQSYSIKAKNPVVRRIDSE
jgi:predicted  nucleic acid-binding Zn-ribbon protein